MDDMSSKISEIFSNPESMEKIKSLIGMLGANGGEAPPEEPHEQTDQMPFDANTLLKMQKAFSLMRKDDPRVTLLLALKPNLSSEKQKKVDEAVHLLKLINLLPMLQEGIFQ